MAQQKSHTTAIIILCVILFTIVFGYLFYLLYKYNIINIDGCSDPEPNEVETPCCAVSGVLNGRRFDLQNNYLLQNKPLYPPAQICAESGDPEKCLGQIRSPCDPNVVRALYRVGSEYYYPVGIGRTESTCESLIIDGLLPKSCISVKGGVFI